MFNLRCFKAGKGDSFLLTWQTDQQHRLLIDSGIEGTYRFIWPLVRDFGKNDYVLITHVDYDHIGGLYKWLTDEQQPFSRETSLYINTPQLLITPDPSDQVAIKHGINLEELLNKREIPTKPLYLEEDSDNILHLDGLELQILSPSKEVVVKLMKEWNASEIYQQYLERKLGVDDKVSSHTDKKWRSKEAILEKPPVPHKWDKDLLNSSSIAFILSFKGMSLLFMGDANPDLVADELSSLGYSKDNRLSLKMLKISHHGSQHNTTKRLLEMIECSEYLISTDSSGPYYHPSRETLVLISEYGRSSEEESIIIYSNYSLDIDKLLNQEERDNIEFKEVEELELILKDKHGAFE